MNWIKKLWKKRETLNYEEILKKDEEIFAEDSFRICDYCGHEIFGQQKHVNKGGKIYHVKPCWRILQKMAKKETFG